MICEHILQITFLSKYELFFFCTKLNGLKYFYQIQIILFTINHLVLHSEMVAGIAVYL